MVGFEIDIKSGVDHSCSWLRRGDEERRRVKDDSGGRFKNKWVRNAGFRDGDARVLLYS